MDLRKTLKDKFGDDLLAAESQNPDFNKDDEKDR